MIDQQRNTETFRAFAKLMGFVIQEAAQGNETAIYAVADYNHHAENVGVSGYDIVELLGVFTDGAMLRGYAVSHVAYAPDGFREDFAKFGFVQPEWH